MILVASAAAAPIARRLSEFSVEAAHYDGCTSALEQKEAIMPASNPLYDAAPPPAPPSPPPPPLQPSIDVESLIDTAGALVGGALIAVIVVPLLCCCGIVALVVFCVVRQQAPKKRAPPMMVSAAGGAGKETTQISVLANSKI